MGTNNQTQRKNWIDWAKAIGILLVVMGLSEYSNPLVVRMIYMIHMPLFFFISGYLFKTNKSLIEISISSWKTLVITYLLFNLISVSFKLIPYIYILLTTGTVDWNAHLFQKILEFPKGIALTMFVGPSWFLLALVWCRYLTYLIHTNKLYISILMITIWIILFIIRVYSGVQYWFAIDCGLAGFIWFELGYLIKNYFNRFPINITNSILYIIILLSAFLCYLGYKYNGQCNYVIADTKGILGIFSTGFGLMAFIGICKLLDKVEIKLITLISKATILIMCMHMMIVPRLDMFMHFEGKMLYTLLGNIFAVLILTAIYPFIQKYIPMLIGGRK